MQNQTAIAQFIVDEYLPDLTPQQLDVHTDLIEDGVIDSLGLLKLLVWLESTFGINADEADPAPENFRSIAAIDAFVSSATRTSIRVD